jgi:hypothetical protein
MAHRTIGHLGFVRPSAWVGRLRGCPLAFGLLLDAATPANPSTRAANEVSARRCKTRDAGKVVSAMGQKRSLTSDYYQATDMAP